MYAEGHEIGNHSYTHPDMGEVTEARARLEINGTSRALQSLIGHGTLLFRVPYNADAEPTSAAEVQPVVYASKLGYYIVGEMIDPEDWLLSERLPNGSVHKRTAKEIADSVVAQVKADRGNSILLHDGGGDRENTVACVPLIVTQLRKLGYHFVLCSALINSNSAAVMPPYNPKDHLLIGADRIVFEVNYILSTFLEITFISAIILGTLRVIFVVTLAVLAYKKEKQRKFDDKYHPKVSVVIAAFNEASVINRTIHGVLDNNYTPLDVVVVDDGSTDGTSARIIDEFGGDERVLLIRQDNQGKASALNNGIAKASGEIVVSLDADTIFARDTISRLVRHFSDETVAAVAGNVKVGNRINILTYWQAIEYVTSQNLDRRAYALINAITVVPGAVGAWRKSVVLAAGGYLRDTLAEDMDLTWRIREMGYRIENDSSARGYTEAPQSLKALFTQRFRWTYGTLQCLWKHRGMIGKIGWFGRVMLPALWLFQIVFQILSPLVDLQMLVAVLSVAHTWLRRGLFQQDWQPLTSALENLWFIGAMYGFFFCIEFIGAWVAFTIERERKQLLWWLFWQRFIYRQLMYAVALRAVKTALKGIHAGWGKLERKGTARKEDPSHNFS
jgi:cellulose synthase/poly-beta-1,6-N-acetylglucosamine synthase-like glycosyltransferase